MRRSLMCALLMVAVASCWWCGCSKSADDDKGFVERANEQMSKSAVDYVNKPLSKARQIDVMAKKRQQGSIDSDEAAAE